jgi:hypothetical protein
VVSLAMVEVDNLTPIIETRDVCYPWHPCAVVVDDVFVKYGQCVCRCWLEGESTRRVVEIPIWMCEPATCGRLRVTLTPTVHCDVLRELQALLRIVRHPARDGVLQAQHRSLLDAGGADATVREPPAPGATHALPSPSFPSVVSDAATGHPREDDPIARSAAAPARGPKPRLRPTTGGVR